jgi:hypothetical protein
VKLEGAFDGYPLPHEIITATIMRFLMVYYLIQFKFTFGTKVLGPWLISAMRFQRPKFRRFFN